MFFIGKKFCISIKFLIIITFFGIQGIFAQSGKFSAETEMRIKNQIIQTETQKKNLTSHEKKTEGRLRELIKIMKDDQSKGTLLSKAAGNKYSSSSIKVNQQLQVRAVITLLSGRDSDSTVVKNQVKNLGGSVDLTVKPTSIMPVEMYCWIPFDQILELAKNTSIGNISPIGSPVVRVGAKLTAGDGQLNANNARQYFYKDGTGIKVGVISNGVSGIANSISSQDLLPINNSSHILNAGDSDGNEGTAMLEIIQDIAPGADLYFAGVASGDGPNGMAARINQLRDAGCQVVVDDLGWVYNSPQFSEDLLYNTIYSYINNPSYNRSYISAAGNDGIACWNGTFFPDADNYNLWWKSGSQYYNSNEFNLEVGEGVDVTLQWADKWNYARTDYDLYVYDALGNLVGQSTDDQGTNGSIPREEVSFTYEPGSYTPPFKIRVKLDITDTPVNEPNKEIRVIVSNYDGLLYKYKNFPTDPGRPIGQIYGKEIVSSIPVGAYPASNQNLLENFSSRGPSNLYSFDGNGVQTGVISYNTPAIVATDGIETNAQGFDFFEGTSAAAPHVAGIAALYYSKFPTGNFKTALTSSAVSIAGGTGGTYNDQSGFGKADARECLIYSLTSISPGIISSNTNWVNVKVSGTTTINDNVVVTIPVGSVCAILGTVNFGNSLSKIIVNSGGTLIIRKGAQTDPSHISGAGQIIFEDGLRIEQLKEDLSLLEGSSIDIYPVSGSGWESFPAPKYLFGVPKGGLRSFRASQQVLSNQKYNLWKVDNITTSDITIYNHFTIANPTSIYTSQFKTTNSATIQAQLETGNIGGFVDFKDPWYIGNTASYNGFYGYHNLGNSAIFEPVTSQSNNIDVNSPFKGVFLNQGAPNWTPPYYSVRAPLTQDIYVSQTNKIHSPISKIGVQQEQRYKIQMLLKLVLCSTALMLV